MLQFEAQLLRTHDGKDGKVIPMRARRGVGGIRKVFWRNSGWEGGRKEIWAEAAARAEA